jgi:hypothetical protein
MDPNYKPLYQKAQSLEHQVYDAIDDHNHPNIRVKTIQHQLIQIRAQGGQAMDYSNVDHFHRNFEDMRQDLRRFRNY